ncbi:MAG: isoprenyl transferase [Sphingobium sp.]
MATRAKSGIPRHAQDHEARHVAIIMDGNGRWAKKRLLPRLAGHRAGVEAVRRVAQAALDLGIECLTIYAFSSENWKRPADEVSDLMGLLRRFIESDVDELHANGIRLKIIGNYKALAPQLVTMIEEAVARTANNGNATLAIALNYGAQDEILRAVQSLGKQIATGEIAPEDIDAARIDAEMYTADLPPLDLLIRTSGEHRLSNFLLWQAAYAELYFTDTLWPDFDAGSLADALASFKLRERRFGGL